MPQAMGSGIDLTTEKLISYGNAIACAGDVNADGYSDILIESFKLNGGGAGAADVLYGSKNGISTLMRKTIISDQAGSYFGWALASAGDVNGDGISDIVVGAMSYEVGAYDDNGAAFIFHGSATGIIDTPRGIITKAQDNAKLGFSVSGARDINSDGFADLIIGAPLYDNGEADEGVAFVYFGNTYGYDDQNPVLLEMDQAGAQFGVSVSDAGDVNGDGYDDVIVGANKYDIQKVDAGAGFVFYGSAQGIKGPGDPVSIDQNAASGGTSVGSAGDVNSDGYDDVIVGVPFYDNGQENEGGAILVLGSAKGVAGSKATILECNLAFAKFGSAVSTAGDVNGDGFDDVVVGAPYHENNRPASTDEGACFVYRGSKTGVNVQNPYLVELNRVGALFGCSVSDAGDINGDGYDDFIAGAQLFSNGQANEGAVGVFYGNVNGPSLANSITIEGNNIGGMFGYSVGSGDFDGDGYSDAVVGSIFYSTPATSKEGAALVFRGSENGIISTPTTVIEGNQADCQMGVSVASAGDLNGDGYDDLLVGADNFVPIQTRTGQVFIYMGNLDIAPGLEKNRGNLITYNEDFSPLSAPNALKEKAGIGLFSKSFLGRNIGKLVWETVAEGQSFSHNSPISNSTKYTADANFSNLQFDNTELKAVIAKVGRTTKVRARIKYHPTLAITGQMYGPWRYADKPLIKDFEAILPVSLISFRAEAIEREVLLTWATATEINSDHFEIQRSSDGKHWENVGRVLAATDSKQALIYSFKDMNPLASTSFYRLKMVDSDGTFAFSAIKSVKILANVSLYPNPVQSQLYFNAEMLVRQVDVFDISGKKVSSFQNNAGIKSIDLSPLPAALYLIKVNGESFQILKK